MLEEAMLRERFQALLDQQQEAVDACAALATSVDDPALRARIEQLHREKQRHLRLTERLLEIVA